MDKYCKYCKNRKEKRCVVLDKYVAKKETCEKFDTKKEEK